MGKSLFGINILETDECFHINLLLADRNFDISLSKLRDITHVFLPKYGKKDCPD